MCASDESSTGRGARVAGRTVIWPSNALSDSAMRQHTSGSASPLAQVLQFGLERQSGPAWRRERRVVLDPLDDASGQWLGVGDGCLAKTDRVVMGHVDECLAHQPPRVGAPTAAALRPRSSARRDCPTIEEQHLPLGRAPDWS
jgi:hypothetical protein